MDNETLEFDVSQGSQKKRPSFLTVLCVLSWISVAMGVFGSIGNVTKNDDALQQEANEAILSMKQSIPDEAIIDQTITFFTTNIETNTPQNYVYLILYLLQGVLVFMMFQQKKIGFYGYLIIQVAFISTMVYFYPWPNIFSSVLVGLSVFTSLLFTILYAVNLKHMD